jgi:TonB family protein
LTAIAAGDGESTSARQVDVTAMQSEANSRPPTTHVGGVPGGIQAPQRVRVSEAVMQGMLEKWVPPIYPTDARVQGAVVLKAVIGKDGTVQSLSVVLGHPMLVTAAIEAVKQWKYRPYQLNGSPVEVETQIGVKVAPQGRPPTSN